MNYSTAQHFCQKLNGSLVTDEGPLKKNILNDNMDIYSKELIVFGYERCDVAQ